MIREKGREKRAILPCIISRKVSSGRFPRGYPANLSVRPQATSGKINDLYRTPEIHLAGDLANGVHDVSPRTVKIFIYVILKDHVSPGAFVLRLVPRTMTYMKIIFGQG